MKEQDINNFYSYFKILRKINITYRKLTKYNKTIDEKEELFYIISGEMLRLFPYKIKFDKDNNFLYEIEVNDGIMLLKDKIIDLKERYENILRKYDITFYQIKNIRNKYEHEPHNIKCVCFMNSKSFKEAIFNYSTSKNNYNIILNTDMLYNLIYCINKEFKTIKNDIDKEAKKANIKNKLKNYKFDFLGDRL